MLKKLITALVVGLIALPTLPLNAKNIPLISKEISIAKAGKKRFELEAIPQRNTTTLLEITSRLHRKTFSGSMPILTIMVNGKEVKTSKTRKAPRLVNKALISMVSTTKRRSWFAEGYAWRIVYGPNFEGALKHKFYSGDPYTLVLDISDFINPAGENLIELINRVDNKNWRWRGLRAEKGALIIRRLNLRIKSGTSPMTIPDAVIKPVINRGEPAAGPSKYTAKVMPGGGFIVNVGKNKWKFSSTFSYPNAGLKHLLPSKKAKISNTPGWSMRIKKQNDGASIFVKGPYYKLNRRIRFTPRRIEIKDKFTNIKNKALGLFVSNEMSFKGIKTLGVRLAGNPDAAVNEYSAPANPSVHVALADQSIGMLCEDDVFRNQIKLFSKAYSAGISTERFRLGPKKSYTLEWAVYPVAGPDYFDFINLVRQDWGANFTLDGPHTLFNPDWILKQPKDRLKKQFAHHGIRYAISNGEWRRGGKNRRSAFGTGGMEPAWADHRRMLREAATRIREVAPRVKILTYFDSRFDSSKGCPERFRDSWWTRADGKQKRTNWGFAGNDCYVFIPMLTNSYGKAILAMLDSYISETGSDGIYWDEMGGAGGFGNLAKTYNIFDGNTCLLDLKKYTIKREIGSPGILLQPFILAAIKHIRSQGRPVMGNGAISSRAILKAKILRMTETQNNTYWCYESNLGSPMGWTYTARSTFDGTTRTISLGCMPLGVQLGSKHEISRFLYPFTPIELHHGYLLGKERAVTLHDGNYGWAGKRCLVQLRHFNSKGILINDDSSTIIGKEARTAVKLAKGEAMVLVRTPLKFNPTAGTAKASKLSYEKNAISLQLDAPQGGVLKINSGKFLLKNGTTVKVSLANKAQSLKVENNSLHINIPAKFNANISIN
jgi:hypothetical protein